MMARTRVTQSHPFHGHLGKPPGLQALSSSFIAHLHLRLRLHICTTLSFTTRSLGHDLLLFDHALPILKLLAPSFHLIPSALVTPPRRTPFRQSESGTGNLTPCWSFAYPRVWSLKLLPDPCVPITTTRRPLVRQVSESVLRLVHLTASPKLLLWSCHSLPFWPSIIAIIVDEQISSLTAADSQLHSVRSHSRYLPTEASPPAPLDSFCSAIILSFRRLPLIFNAGCL
ncbi:hypothetical protein L228DRAFT_143715 [Xylona heveae TC161]|uniref:Uncharacterized protein n=1 Tax=Xylona heveae (strain CBS 132557 / TC161) TaxID=1328760 RepID=A0A165GAM3_XYLHT|nr:hypothetical protein L228DRAFT_143715 [Xylona heveae TC161]KZF21953.1 hypothetical protein L228DRAFT_143715 [Xylona heveae TC161]